MQAILGKKGIKIPLITKHNLNRYVVFLAGAGLTTASFLVPGGSLALLSSGIMCGAGLKMTINSFQDLTKTEEDKEKDNTETEGMDDLLYETANGALNGFISSLGLVCIAQNECNDDMNGAQQLITSYALTGLITGTINGTINEIIHSSHAQNTKQPMHGPNDDDIELMNVGKTGFMEMGSNLITAIGKSTLFKSAKDDRSHTNHREVRIHFPSYRQMRQHFDDFTKQKRDLFQFKVLEYGSIHSKRAQKVSNCQFTF